MTDTTPTLASLKPADKIVGAILALLVIGALGTGLVWLLPILIELAKDTIIFGVELVAAALLAIVFLDPHTWTNIYYGWRNISRNARKAIVREDPIGVLDTVISRLEGKLEDIDQNMTTAAGAVKRQADGIAKAKRESDNQLQLAKEATNRHKPQTEIDGYVTAAKRWSDAADSFIPMRDMLAKMQGQLEKARDLAAAALANAKNQKSVLSLQLETLQDGQQAVRGFKRFFGNNPDLDMQEMAVEEIERQSAQAEAEIDQFMRAIDPMIQQQDLQKQADASAAMAKFGAFLSSAPEQKTLAAAPDSPDVVPTKKIEMVRR